MPSGAKKRKAAKRKNELSGVHPDSPTSALQGDGGRDEDEHLNGSHNTKGSESGTELVSPGSQEGETAGEGETTEPRDRHEVMYSSENDSKGAGESLDAEKPKEEAAAELEHEEGNSPPCSSSLAPPPPPPPPSTSAAVPIFEPEVVTIEHAKSEMAEDVGGSLEVPLSVEGPTERVLEMPVAEGTVDLVERSVPDSEDVVRVSEEPIVPISQEVVQVSDVLVENIKVESVMEEPLSHKNEEKVVPLMGVVVEQPHGNAENCPCTESRGIVETTEPQVALSNHTEQVALSNHTEHRASWMSCCGLFDALMGSHR